MKRTRIPISQNKTPNNNHVDLLRKRLSYNLCTPHRVRASVTELSYIGFNQQCGFNIVPHSLLEGSEANLGSLHHQIPLGYVLSHISYADQPTFSGSCQREGFERSHPLSINT